MRQPARSRSAGDVRSSTSVVDDPQAVEDLAGASRPRSTTTRTPASSSRRSTGPGTSARWRRVSEQVLAVVRALSRRGDRGPPGPDQRRRRRRSTRSASGSASRRLDDEGATTVDARVGGHAGALHRRQRRRRTHVGRRPSPSRQRSSADPAEECYRESDADDGSGRCFAQIVARRRHRCVVGAVISRHPECGPADRSGAATTTRFPTPTSSRWSGALRRASKPSSTRATSRSTRSPPRLLHPRVPRRSQLVHQSTTTRTMTRSRPVRLRLSASEAGRPCER